ncbi:MAG: hypothetical protein UY04_C0007G0008 [Parcubacteria group bacterium GW2011_GWA2_47_7]|nr:MAG: hypothetical protein UY04_C0007G0008 [Parcubacteria group bacterium GW2011_GWA2_47_7]
MEHQKDNNQGRPNTIGQTPQTYQGYGYIVRKAEKLTTALYLVTDILSDKEPMKWRVREVGVDVLSDITVAGSTSVSEKMSTLRTVIKKIEKLVSFLDVATSTRMMSEMNASMLRKEYLALRDGVEAEWNRMQERSKAMLNERFFDVPRDTRPMIEEKSVVESVPAPVQMRMESGVSVAENISAKDTSSSTSKEQSSQTFTPSVPVTRSESMPQTVQNEVPRNDNREAPRFIPSVQRERLFTPPRVTISDSDVIARSHPDVTRNDRRKIILALIKQKPAITVSDIAKSIPGISEKTIQRELLSMVSENVLVKRGERRWSTYSLREG